MAPILPAQIVCFPCHHSDLMFSYLLSRHMRFYQIHICCADSKTPETKYFDNLQLAHRQMTVVVVVAWNNWCQYYCSVRPFVSNEDAVIYNTGQSLHWSCMKIRCNKIVRKNFKVIKFVMGMEKQINLFFVKMVWWKFILVKFMVSQ